MVPRFAGATLGLLAFAATLVAGLSVGNPPAVILSRSIVALFIFCSIGLCLGWAAQLVVAEYERKNAADKARQRGAQTAASVSDSSADAEEALAG